MGSILICFFHEYKDMERSIYEKAVVEQMPSIVVSITKCVCKHNFWTAQCALIDKMVSIHFLYSLSYIVLVFFFCYFKRNTAGPRLHVYTREQHTIIQWYTLHLTEDLTLPLDGFKTNDTETKVNKIKCTFESIIYSTFQTKHTEQNVFFG